MVEMRANLQPRISTAQTPYVARIPSVGMIDQWASVRKVRVHYPG